MSEYAIIDAATNAVVAVYIFFGSPDWPKEPADEASAAAIIQQWNDRGGNPLQTKPGDLIMRTDINAPSSRFRGKYAGIGDSWSKSLGIYVPPKPFDSWEFDLQAKEWQAPVPLPVDAAAVTWSEASRNWVDKSTVFIAPEIIPVDPVAGVDHMDITSPFVDPRLLDAVKDPAAEEEPAAAAAPEPQG